MQLKRKEKKKVTPTFDAIKEAEGDGIVKYGIDKRVKQPWNRIVGMQYIHNKS